MAGLYYWSWRKAVEDIDDLIHAIREVAEGRSVAVVEDGQLKIKTKDNDT